MNFIKINILVVLILIIISVIPAFSCDDEDDDECHTLPHCHGCGMNIIVVDPNVFLGKFFTGSTNVLPAETGEGNILEFYLYGNNRITYNFSFNMRLHSRNGGDITQWSWRKMDRSTYPNWSQQETNKKNPYTCIKLIKQQGQSHCKSYARFQLTAKELKVSPNARPGVMNFTITVTACANI